MNKQDLKNFIKGIVRENLETHEYKELLKEVSPPGEKAERMIQHVKASLRKSHPDWSEDKITGVAIATGWKAHNKGSVEEKDSVDEKKDKKWIQKAVEPSHKGYCTPMTKPTCTPRRKALAQRFKKGLQEYGYKIVPDTLAKVQKDDQARTVQTDPKMNEASYKVVSPTQARCSKCDQARTIQTDPKMNETAYKTQGPSLKTFDDSHQFPDAENNPKNA